MGLSSFSGYEPNFISTALYCADQVFAVGCMSQNTRSLATTDEIEWPAKLIDWFRLVYFQ